MAVACAGGKQRELEGSSEYEAMQIQHSETGGLTAVDLAYTNTRRPTAIAMAPPRSKLDSSDTQQQMPLLYSCSRLRSRHGSFRLTESSSCRGKLRGSELHTQTQRCQRARGNGTWTQSWNLDMDKDGEGEKREKEGKEETGDRNNEKAR